MTSVDTERTITVSVNGVPREATVPVRRLLSDALRHDLELTGTHVGCEHGVCGACTVLVDGTPVRSCLMLAVQVDGHEVQTVEGLARDDGRGGQVLHPVQEAFRECHALQCGFCTPGFLMTIKAGLENREPGGRDHRGRGRRAGRRQPLQVHGLREHQEGRPPRRRRDEGRPVTGGRP